MHVVGLQHSASKLQITLSEGNVEFMAHIRSVYSHQCLSNYFRNCSYPEEPLPMKTKSIGVMSVR